MINICGSPENLRTKLMLNGQCLLGQIQPVLGFFNHFAKLARCDALLLFK